MTIDVSKACSDHLRQLFRPAKLQASHARELVAAFFGYKSHAALLSEKEWPLFKLEEAAILIPKIQLIAERRTQLSGVTPSDLSAREIAQQLVEFLKTEGLFNGVVWMSDSLEKYILEDYLPANEYRLYDELSGVMAETNAFFDWSNYEEATLSETDTGLSIVVNGSFEGETDLDKPYSGDVIDFEVLVTLDLAAGKTAFHAPHLEASGTVRDWLDAADVYE